MWQAKGGNTIQPRAINEMSNVVSQGIYSTYSKPLLRMLSVLAKAHMKSSGGPPLPVPGRANIFGPIEGESLGASTNQSPCQAARVLIHRQEGPSLLCFACLDRVIPESKSVFTTLWNQRWDSRLWFKSVDLTVFRLLEEAWSRSKELFKFSSLCQLNLICLFRDWG